MTERVTIAVDEADAVDLLLELNRVPGVEARFGETKPTVEARDDHPSYLVDYATLVPLVVGLGTNITTLATALVNFMKAKSAKAPAQEAAPPPKVTIYIDDRKIEITTADTTASVEVKLGTADA